jgi:hypothetical protein
MAEVMDDGLDWYGDISRSAYPTWKSCVADGGGAGRQLTIDLLDRVLNHSSSYNLVLLDPYTGRLEDNSDAFIILADGGVYALSNSAYIESGFLSRMESMNIQLIVERGRNKT